MPVLLNVPKQKVKNPPLKVCKLGDRVLRQPSKRISKVNDEIRQIAVKMLQTMYSNDGIGLSAPQVGIHKQLVVIDCEPNKPEIAPLIMINPEIESFGKETTVGEEGCLSIPDVYLDVARPDEIVVSYRDEEGRPQRMQVSGLLSRVIQHEMDHLKGVMFVDRVQNAIAVNRELNKRGFSIKDVQPIS